MLLCLQDSKSGSVIPSACDINLGNRGRSRLFTAARAGDSVPPSRLGGLSSTRQRRQTEFFDPANPISELRSTSVNVQHISATVQSTEDAVESTVNVGGNVDVRPFPTVSLADTAQVRNL